MADLRVGSDSRRRAGSRQPGFATASRGKKIDYYSGRHKSVNESHLESNDTEPFDITSLNDKVGEIAEYIGISQRQALSLSLQELHNACEHDSQNNRQGIHVYDLTDPRWAWPQEVLTPADVAALQKQIDRGKRTGIIKPAAADIMFDRLMTLTHRTYTDERKPVSVKKLTDLLSRLGYKPIPNELTKYTAATTWREANQGSTVTIVPYGREGSTVGCIYRVDKDGRVMWRARTCRLVVDQLLVLYRCAWLCKPLT